MDTLEQWHRSPDKLAFIEAMNSPAVKRAFALVAQIGLSPDLQAKTDEEHRNAHIAQRGFFNCLQVFNHLAGPPPEPQLQSPAPFDFKEPEPTPDN
jgi:predicted TIM-barrel fold metal-dependent hydrolase